ncbi:MAG TPA: MarR family transcriptional regulator [Jatrophihabitans sp.]|jgi:DNA-binding MarR family transcriptional regulator|nr:MarR family transcriptional regulator [Jatrophihabitans sp.]
MGKRDDDELARAWQELMNRYHRVSCVLDRALQADHGISGSEFAILEQLFDTRDCSLRLHELGEHCHVTQSALSRLVARLEADGLVERTMCADDRRSVSARLTPAGRELYRRARPTHRAVLRETGGECLAAVGSVFATTG